MIDVDEALKRLASCAGCTEHDMMYSRCMMPSSLRQLLWRDMYDEGLHPVQIADLFHRDRTTILYGLDHALSMTKANGYERFLKVYEEAMAEQTT